MRTCPYCAYVWYPRKKPGPFDRCPHCFGFIRLQGSEVYRIALKKIKQEAQANIEIARLQNKSDEDLLNELSAQAKVNLEEEEDE